MQVCVDPRPSYHSIDAGRSPDSGAGGSYRLISAVGTRAAADRLHIAATYWVSIDGADRRTDGRTDT